MRAMAHSRADVLTAAMAEFEGDQPPDGGIGAAKKVFAPLGGAFAGGAYANLYGDAHACFRRSALAQLGGFSEDFGLGHEDWELFARATLSGMSVLAIPEPLFWYRISADSMLRRRPDADGDLMRSGRPFLEMLPPQLRPALSFALRTSGTATLTPHSTVNRLVGRCVAMAARPVAGLPIRVAWRLAGPLVRRILGTDR